MLGDAYCAAVVEHLSKDDLAKMDKMKGEADEQELLLKTMENGHMTVVVKETNKVRQGPLLSPKKQFYFALAGRARQRLCL